MPEMTQPGNRPPRPPTAWAVSTPERPSWAAGLPAPLPEAVVVEARDELLRCPYRERRAVLHRLGPEGRLQVVLALVEAGFGFRHSDAKEGLRVAQLAYQCAYRYLCMPAGLRPAGRQVRAAALGFLANAYRVLGQHFEAERCWEHVRALPRREELPPALRARLLDLEASLARGRRHFQRALALLRRAEEVGRPVHSPWERALLLLKLAKTSYDAGAPERAMAPLLAAMDAMPNDLREPIHGPGALLSLLHILLDIREPQLAARLLWRYGGMIELFDEPMLHIRACWILGRLLRELGDAPGSARQLEEVREAFLAREQQYEASLVGLELALAYAMQREYGKVSRLAHEVYPVFRALDVPREALMAVIEFVEAAEQYRAEAEVITGVLERLREIERRDRTHLALDAPSSDSPP